ncbi:hypothetical protein NT05LI_3487, partial [Listeria ivanovii FSL F6-596]
MLANVSSVTTVSTVTFKLLAIASANPSSGKTSLIFAGKVVVALPISG